MQLQNKNISMYLEFLYLEEKLQNDLLLTEMPNFSEMKKQFSGQILKAENIVKKYININDLKKLAKSYSKKLKTYYEQGKTPEDASKLMCKDIATNIVSKVKKLSLPKKIIYSIAGLYLLIVMNLLMNFSLIWFARLTAVQARNVCSIIFAPIFEETLKNYFIQKGMPWIGTGIVFGIELVDYLVRFITSGGNVLKTLLVRAVTLLMHFSTTYVQKKIIESGEEKDVDRKFVAFLVGFGIHASFNGLMIIFNPQLTAFINK